jgi:hypothetical protein
MCEAEMKSKLCIQMFNPLAYNATKQQDHMSQQSFGVVHAVQNIHVHPLQNIDSALYFFRTKSCELL